MEAVTRKVQMVRVIPLGHAKDRTEIIDEEGEAKPLLSDSASSIKLDAHNSNVETEEDGEGKPSINVNWSSSEADEGEDDISEGRKRTGRVNRNDRPQEDSPMETSGDNESAGQITISSDQEIDRLHKRVRKTLESESGSAMLSGENGHERDAILLEEDESSIGARQATRLEANSEIIIGEMKIESDPDCILLLSNSDEESPGSSSRKRKRDPLPKKKNLRRMKTKQAKRRRKEEEGEGDEIIEIDPSKERRRTKKKHEKRRGKSKESDADTMTEESPEQGEDSGDPNSPHVGILLPNADLVDALLTEIGEHRDMKIEGMVEMRLADVAPAAVEGSTCAKVEG